MDPFILRPGAKPTWFLAEGPPFTLPVLFPHVQERRYFTPHLIDNILGRAANEPSRTIRDGRLYDIMHKFSIVS